MRYIPAWWSSYRVRTPSYNIFKDQVKVGKLGTWAHLDSPNLKLQFM